jgi:archaellum component FlaC
MVPKHLLDESEVSESFVIEDLSQRVRIVEGNNRDSSLLIGKMESVFTTISSDINEIKQDVKGIAATQNEMKLQAMGLDGRIKDLESIRDSSKDSRKAIRTTLLSVLATVAAAAIVYFLKFK